MTAKQLRVARVAAGLTQDALADMAGVARRTVGRYEADTGPLPPTHEAELLERLLCGCEGVSMKGGTLVVRVEP